MYGGTTIFFKRSKFRKIAILLQTFAIAVFIIFVTFVAYYKIISLVGWSWLVIIDAIPYFGSGSLLDSCALPVLNCAIVAI